MNHKSKGALVMIVTVLIMAALVFVAVFGVKVNGKSIAGAKSINLGLDLAGGVSITYETDKDDPTDEEIKDTIYKLQKRADSSGQTEANVYREGANRINVDIPGATNAEETLRQLGKVGEILFFLGTNNIAENPSKPGEYILTKTIDEIRAQGDIILEGNDVKTARAEMFQEQNGLSQNGVSLELNESGRKKFAEATAAHVGELIAIYYDEKIVSAPVVKQALTDGKAMITGNFTTTEANNLASTIRVGALPLQLHELRSNVVGATLGQKAVSTSLMAALIGLALVLVFMAVRYRIPGIAADLALIIYTALMVVCLSLLDITLTLPGLAGIILSIGMAVDANVIIFSRIQEEIGVGKTVRSSIKLGFNKAFSAIFDGNITTLIAAIVLYLLGSGTVKGFATTLALGIILSMFTALCVTKVILVAFYNLGLDSEKVYGQVKEYKITKYTKHWKKYAIISGVLILTGISAIIISKVTTGDALSYGLDFKGGTSMSVAFPEGTNPSIQDLEKATYDAIGTEATVSLVSATNSAVIKTKELSEAERSKLQEYLVSKYNVSKDEIEVTNISGTVSGEMKRDAIIAVAVATVCMLIYIWFRFSNLAFAASAVLALIHDVLVVLMVYAVARISVGNTFIACMLTIVGYSINATIVVFDRIRENLKEQTRKETVEDIVNKSISQTFSRNIYTSLTTFVMVAALVIFGVPAIREFAFPLMMGIVCGAYSSICITGVLWKGISEALPKSDED